jgi:hypothetical protein
VTVPGAHGMVGRLGVVGSVYRELERSEHSVMTTIWAPMPSTRQSVGAAVRNALAAQRFIALADGFAAKLTYRMTNEDDVPQKDREYRRNIAYWVEYGVFQTDLAWTVTLPVTVVHPQADDAYLNPLAPIILDPIGQPITTNS